MDGHFTAVRRHYVECDASGLGDPALADACRADGAPQHGAAFLGPNPLQVGEEAALGDARDMQTDSALGLGKTTANDRISGCGPLAA